MYPILGHIVGALAAFVGGVNVASPIIGENLVFVSLLALGCYQTGRLLFGPLAGLLAVVFAFGSPLLISMFHVFMLDAPLTAAVAVSMWLIARERGLQPPGRVGLAGLAVGLGLNVKAQFALFLVGARRHRPAARRLAQLARLRDLLAVALAVGTPWYVVHLSELGTMLELASSGPGTPRGQHPADASRARTSPGTSGAR